MPKHATGYFVVTPGGNKEYFATRAGAIEHAKELRALRKKNPNAYEKGSFKIVPVRSDSAGRERPQW